MEYNLNIRQEVFGATVSIVKTGKREYIDSEELEEFLKTNRLPIDALGSNLNQNYKVKYIPLNNKNIKGHFAFADIAYLEVTRQCNLRCKHCLNDSGKSMEKQLTNEELKALVQNLANCGIQEIRFTGGEPILFENIYGLIELATQNGICTSIGTNGTLINKEVAEKLYKAGLKKAVVSIDGTEEKHNMIRGKETYIKAIEGLKYLNEAGVNVRVNAVIMKNNMEDIINLAKYMNENKITLFIRRFIQSGRGELLKDDMLTKEDYLYVKQQLRKEIEEGIYINGHYLRNDEGVNARIKLPFEIRGCKAGQRAIAIMPDGEIQLCGFLAAQNFPSIGNVRDIDDWNKFWCDIQKLDMLKFLRDNLDKYNSQENVQETYCLAYIQNYLNKKK